MGSQIILNDTLQITVEQGFPKELDLHRHLQNNFKPEDFAGQVFSFTKPEIRIYQTSPTPVSLVQNLDGKWIYWGRAQIFEQTIHADENKTTGRFRITKIYPPELMKLRSKFDVDPDKEFTNF